MNKFLALTLSVPILLAISSSVFACDDKACEAAYLSATTQYIGNHSRHAETAKTEREAYAKTGNEETTPLSTIYSEHVTLHQNNLMQWHQI